MAVATEPGSTHRVGLYLQDKHPIRDGMRYAQLAEAAGFRGGLAGGGEPPRAGGNRADGRVRCRHGPDRDRQGVVNSWTRNVSLLAATFSTLDDLAPGRIKLGDRRLVGPLASKVGIRRRRPSRPCARWSRSPAAC